MDKDFCLRSNLKGATHEPQELTRGNALQHEIPAQGTQTRQSAVVEAVPVETVSDTFRGNQGQLPPRFRLAGNPLGSP